MKSPSQKPTFINVGPGRCATTWMYEILKAHPDISMAMVKETEFFNTNFQNGQAWYENHFSPSTCTAIGEISNAYYVDPRVAERVRKYNPQMKIIFNLRKPQDLLQSFYGFALRRGLQFASSTEALAAPIGRIMGSGYDFRRKKNCLNPGDQVTLLDSVLLSQKIRTFKEVFPPEQIYFFVYERLKQENEQLLKEIYRFLGVDHKFIPDLAHKVINAAIVPNSKIVARLATKVSFGLRRIGAYQLLSRLHRSELIKKLFYSQAAELPTTGEQRLLLDQSTLEMLAQEEETLRRWLPDLENYWTVADAKPVEVASAR
ncbi:MAG: sulfotransferase domain-containing protein [Pirellulaceae bacterium]